MDNPTGDVVTVEIVSPDRKEYIRIYISGRIETNLSLPTLVFNRIPQLLAEAYAAGRKEAQP